ncbi:hypothetical protein E2N92_01025 [Methanofollis formosanus]|uniref:Uncharacterized protein n=1 Tax=Methanofollis formosanus TaxID=299308 RepID=A0A8G0ZYK1_9EURY|nr:hypothetical protein [Methanofollis formosanus]QYZ78111.1 hypothetical protein E2N92_01025 [Methanofollis formosanus]
MPSIRRCPSCTIYYDESLPACPFCGAPNDTLPHGPLSSPDRGTVRNPLVAALCSLLWVGWGQWYNGRTDDGLFYLGAYTVTALLATFLVVPLFFVSFWASAAVLLLAVAAVVGILGHSIYDAYRTADKINRGDAAFTGKSRLFWVPASVYVLVIAMIAVILLIGPVPPAEEHADDIIDAPVPVATTPPAPDTQRTEFFDLFLTEDDLPADYAPPRYKLIPESDLSPTMRELGANVGFVEFFSEEPAPKPGDLVISQKLITFPEGNATRMVDSDYETYSIGRNEVLDPPAIGENSAAFKLIGRDRNATEDHIHYVITFSQYDLYEMFVTVGPDPDYELLEDLAVKAAAKIP